MSPPAAAREAALKVISMLGTSDEELNECRNWIFFELKQLTVLDWNRAASGHERFVGWRQPLLSQTACMI